MEVQDQVDGGWFLLREGNHHYLAVNCHLPLVDISLLIRLEPDEETELHALGRTFADYLAAKVAYWPDRYRPRDLDRELGAEVDAAVARWRAGAVPREGSGGSA
ncbi:hypothetical protein [Paractinoplanes globisporus]|uniref:Uncharacterized protein n=1 Tax=Paractinoplanes globisporus TaxID=113565 RepID=A0ABW6W7E4_9ACTN|nr:hypothetical protein [Actinoplanes globisporus]